MISLPPADCVNLFLQQAQRLGIEVSWASKGMRNLEASYHAYPGKPGLILLNNSIPRSNAQKICTLLTHEMVHVLQHWEGHLKTVPPLGWPTDDAPLGRNLSRQEKEAYSAQSSPKFVLDAVKSLKPAATQFSP